MNLFRSATVLFRRQLASQERSFASRVKGLGKKGGPKETIPAECLPVVAIVGRPNVGKSALFNRFLRRGIALVHNTPKGHVTRDYREGRGSLADLQFTAIDTSGLEQLPAAGSIQERTARITAGVLRRCDLALLLLDARAGVVPADEALVAWLRASVQAPALLVANKAERRGNDASSDVGATLAEATRLGMGEAVAISAETGEGLVDLYSAMQPILDSVVEQRMVQREVASSVPGTDGMPEAPEPIKLAIIGQPNVGKSTLANRLLGRERVLTGPEPGLTRDAVRDEFRWEGHHIVLVDTAGWAPLANLPTEDPGDAVVEGALQQAQRSWNMAQVVLLMADAQQAAAAHTQGLTRRDLALASKVVQEGRALLILLNKLDTLPEAAAARVVAAVGAQLESSLAEAVGTPCLGISALTGLGAGEVMPTVLRAYDTWNQRVPTARLNRWLVQLIEDYRDTAQGRQVLRLRYVTQVSNRPPAFAAFIAGAEEMGDNTTKFLLNALRKKFGFPGVPLRLVVRHKGQADSRPKAKGPGPRKKRAPVTTVYVQKPPGRRAPGKYVLGGRQPG